MGEQGKGWSLVVSFGRYGGFYWFRGTLGDRYSTRLCLGWMAITYLPEDIDNLFHRLLDAIPEEHANA